MNNFGEYCKKYGLRIAAAVLIVAVIFGISTKNSSGGSSLMEKATMSMITPARTAATGAFGWLEKIYGYMFRYDKLVEENESLKQENDSLKQQIDAASQAESENENYRKLLELREKFSDFVLESATIVDRGTSNWNSTLTISKGSESGIEVGDCVIDSSYNVVGQVAEVGDGWSTVRTVIDTDINIGALVGNTGSAAMIVGDYTLMKNGQVKLSYLATGTQVFEGDKLVTSGKGGSFPRGLTIGSVAEVRSEANGQVEYAAVDPAADIGNVSQIFVIKDFTVVE